jgi:hypothetical protein
MYSLSIRSGETDMTKRTFCGDLINQAGDHLGCIHKAEGGFVVRKPDGRSIGPVIFNGRTFKGSDFALKRTDNLGYAVVKSYALKEAA